MSVHVDSHNLLAHIDAETTLPALARALGDQGFMLPIARALPRMTLARAVVALPYLLDAFIQQANGTSLSGAPFETVCAPRAAIGPSVVHALCTRPPLLRLGRARMRVMAAARTRILVAELGSPADAAACVADVLDEARAFSAEAVGARVVALVPAGTRSLMSRYDTTDSFSHPRRGFLSSTISISAGDRLAMADALARGARVLSAPFMGRAAIGERARVPATAVDARAAIDAVTRALSTQHQGAL